MTTVVLGGAPSVWDELSDLMQMTRVDCVVATNEAGAYCALRVNHWVTLHHEKMKDWWDLRMRNGYSPPDKVWFHAPSRHFVLPHESTGEWGGSSGLFGVKIALELGHKRIVVCGMPLIDGPHFHTEQKMTGCKRYRRAWEAHVEELAPFVRSMSGWTKELLGEPDEFWLTTQGENADGAQGSVGNR